MESIKLLQRVEVIQGHEGTTEVHIPPPVLWDCMECFGENGVDASFTFHPPEFIARVRHSTVPRIRETLSNWVVPENSVKH